MRQTVLRIGVVRQTVTIVNAACSWAMHEFLDLN